jgi:hypothetical protein
MAATAHKPGTPARADAFPRRVTGACFPVRWQIRDMPGLALCAQGSPRGPGMPGELFDSHGFLGLLLLFCRILAKKRRLAGRPVNEGG